MNVKRLFSAGVCAAAIGAAGGAVAQGQDPISDCRDRSSTEAAQIACLEGVVRSLLSVQAAAPAASAQTAPEEQVTPEATEEKARLAAAETATEEAPTGIGAEQVVRKQESESPQARKAKREKEKSEAVTAKIADFARSNTGRLIIVLDNGQVWAQRTSDSANVRLREGETPDVTVRRGAFSGYRMEISDPNVTIIVERLK